MAGNELNANKATCTLAAAYTAGNTTITVTGATYGTGYGQFPIPGTGQYFRAQCGSLILKVTAVNTGTNVWTVSVVESVDTNQPANIAVTAVLTAGEAQEMHQEGFADLTAADFASANVDGVAGTASLRTLGTGSQQSMPGNATPTPAAHAASHALGGGDQVALDATQITAGSLAAARLPDSTASAIGGVEAAQAATSGHHPVAFTVAPGPSGDTSGATDNANLQAIHDAWPAAGGILALQAGTYTITGLAFSKPTMIVGVGRGITTVNCPSATANALNFTVSAFTVRDLTLANTSGSAPTAGAGINAPSGAAYDARISYVAVLYFYDCLDLDGGHWTLAHSFISGPVHYGTKITNTATPDDGDMEIIDCLFATYNRVASALVRYESGGGLRFIGNKLNAFPTPTDDPTYGFELAIADGATTVDCLIVGNSFENFATAGIRIHLGGASHTGVFSQIVINDNQFAAYNTTGTTAVLVNPEASGKISDIIASGNVIDDTGTGFSLSNVANVTLGQNLYDTVTTKVSQGTGLTNLVQTATLDSSGNVPLAQLGNVPSSGALSGDTDVLISSPADGDLLTYVSSASKWENKPAGGGGSGTSGNLDEARYHQAAATAQSIPSAAVTIINYDTQDWDTGSLVTTGASWKFTAAVAGKYRISASILMSSAAWSGTESLDFRLYKNGVDYAQLARWQTPGTLTTFVQVAGGDVVSLAAGDHIDIRVNQNTGSAITLFGDATYNYVAVERIDGYTINQVLVTKTANYTATASDGIIVANAASLTITLPSASAAGSGRSYTIKNGASGTSTTVASTSGTIDGGATDTTLTAAYAVGRYVSDGTNWLKV